MHSERWERAGLALAAGLLALAPGPASAQAVLGLRVPSQKVMQYEAIEAVVEVQNNSGRLLRLGGAEPGAARLRLEIERDGHKTVARRDAAPLADGTAVVPGERQAVPVNVTRHYAMGAMGRYALRALLELDGATYASPAVILDVVPGFELQRLTAGVPGAAGVARTYVLAYLQKDPGEDLYLRIEDPAGDAIHGLFNLGRMVRMRPPEMRVDGAGNVHVLFQTLGMAYVHAAFTPYGVRLFATPLAGARGQARLELLPSGQVVVPDAAAPAPAGTAPAEDRDLLESGRKKVGTGGWLGRMQREAPAKP